MLHRYGHDRTIAWGVLNHGSIWCAFSAERPFILCVVKCPCNTLWDPAVHVICCLGKNSSATSAGKARQKRLHMSEKLHLTGRHNRKLMKEFFRQEQATQWRNWLYSTSCVRRNEMSWAHSEIAQPRSYFTHRDDQSKTPSWWKADHWVSDSMSYKNIYEICCWLKDQNGSNALNALIGNWMPRGTPRTSTMARMAVCSEGSKMRVGTWGAELTSLKVEPSRQVLSRSHEVVVIRSSYIKAVSLSHSHSN